MSDQNNKPKRTPFSERTAESIYLEYVNDWLTVVRMAENYNRSEEELTKLIDQGRKDHDSKFVFIPTHVIANGEFKDTPVMMRVETSAECTVQLKDGKHELVHTSELMAILPPPRIFLTENQRHNLINTFAIAIMKKSGCGMNEAHGLAAFTTIEWARTNNIDLT